MRTGRLDPAARSRAIDALARTSAATPLDILVVGGGVTGAGVALDAATRGLRVGIVDAGDWASGTSSKSSKLVHGGLRYLEMLDFALVAEALRERDLLLTTLAPHLVRPVSFVFPLDSPVADRAYIGSGMTLYDAMAIRPGTRRAMPLHRHLGPRGLRSRFPGLRTEHGGIEYGDAQVDDARLTHTLIRTAVAHGAVAANHAPVTGYLHASEEAAADGPGGPAATEATGTATPEEAAQVGPAAGDRGRGAGEAIVGVRARDELTGEEFTIHARHTVLATGVWTERQEQLAGSSAGLRVLASKGIHITVPRDRIAADPGLGVITRTETSVLFIIPWDELWLIGTTDTPWRESVSHPLVTAEDIERVLANANAVLSEPLERTDVVAAYAGLRPLVQPPADSDDSTRVSREHAIEEVAPGASAIVGGKLTTYRVMAEDAVDFALRARRPHPRSRTESVPLLGADITEITGPRRERLLAAHGWDDARLDRLLHRYGSLLGELLDLIDERPELAEPLPGAREHLAVEAVYAVRAEGAVHLADVLHRRLRCDLACADRGVEAARSVAALIAPDLGWDAEATAAELRGFTAEVAAQRAAERTRTDAEAVAEYAARSRE
ncbi:glycerol-3-phosphate dehydrogenase/oxidase [Brevibacterium sp. R8603A2]|uniref:glycerol-3-phosphate dehydrogenase/oxidase n=1 Tax=Brevibacterium sp. R8603A2 TaxID=2929779 RepID=UPI001FF7203D|nr:glycerol-3-phosphate dehydrogenase/oxidase [Brevibacterium sp. R8603A2]MCK1803338.1 glycerol-3-phosphate dehydrogenase/oxidase [Brevibacterium sp. R8603A2]